MADTKTLLEKINRSLDHTAMPEPDGRMKKVKRPRLVIRRNSTTGGWKGHPNSLLALELHRGRTQFGAGGLKQCKHCKRAAVKGLQVCMHHGAAYAQKLRRIKDNCARYHRPRVASNTVDRLLQHDALPRELISNSVFRAVHDALDAERTARIEMHQRGTNNPPMREPAALHYLNALKLLRWEVVRAWLVFMEEDDRAPWTAAVGKARELGLIA